MCSIDRFLIAIVVLSLMMHSALRLWPKGRLFLYSSYYYFKATLPIQVDDVDVADDRHKEEEERKKSDEAAAVFGVGSTASIRC